MNLQEQLEYDRIKDAKMEKHDKELAAAMMGAVLLTVIAILAILLAEWAGK